MQCRAKVIIHPPARHCIVHIWRKNMYAYEKKKLRKKLAAERFQIAKKQTQLFEEYCQDCVIRRTTPFAQRKKYCGKCVIEAQMNELGDIYEKNILQTRGLRTNEKWKETIRQREKAYSE